MPIENTVLVGNANGDVHFISVPEDQDAGQVTAREAEQIGKETNTGLRTLVVSASMNEDKTVASLTYAAWWNETEVEVLVRTGDRVATSQRLYYRYIDNELNTPDLLDFCRRLKLN